MVNLSFLYDILNWNQVPHEKFIFSKVGIWQEISPVVQMLCITNSLLVETTNWIVDSNCSTSMSILIWFLNFFVAATGKNYVVAVETQQESHEPRPPSRPPTSMSYPDERPVSPPGEKCRRFLGEKSQSAMICLNFNFWRGGFWNSKVTKCHDLPKFQFSGGKGVFWNWKVTNCHDLPKFQFSGGGVGGSGGGVFWNWKVKVPWSGRNRLSYVDGNLLLVIGIWDGWFG